MATIWQDFRLFLERMLNEVFCIVKSENKNRIIKTTLIVKNHQNE
ncbi:hypothetical protein [Flavobacterium sp. CFS9]